MFAVGVLYSSQSFLKLVRNENITIELFQDSFRRFEVADAVDVLALVQKCQWVNVSKDGALQLTERGQTIVQVADAGMCLRLQLADLIVVASPSWAKRLPLGRFEVRKTMPGNAEQCFKECGLFGECDDDVVDWWDLVTQGVRSRKSSFNMRIGRAAERFTVVREKARTGKEPDWQAIESNVSGYDVLSYRDREKNDRLQIEVKGSLMHANDAGFFVTRNEWQTAQNSAAYEFHLWLVRDKPKLFVVSACELEAHLPTNKGGGQWETAQLWFRDFASNEHPLEPETVASCNDIRVRTIPAG